MSVGFDNEEFSVNNLPSTKSVLYYVSRFRNK